MGIQKTRAVGAFETNAVARTHRSTRARDRGARMVPSRRSSERARRRANEGTRARACGARFRDFRGAETKKITIIHLVSPLATGEIGDASTRIAVFLLLLAKASLATEGGFDGLAPGFGVANRAREIRAPGKTNVGDAT